MNYTKKNGSLIRRSSKKLIEKNKIVYPKYRFGYSMHPNVRSNISYKKQGKFVKGEIKTVFFHPVSKYKSKNYLVKNTILITNDGDKVRLTNLNEGRLLGTLVY